MDQIPLVFLQVEALGIIHEVSRLTGGERGKILEGVSKVESTVSEFMRDSFDVLGFGGLGLVVEEAEGLLLGHIAKFAGILGGFYQE